MTCSMPNPETLHEDMTGHAHVIILRCVKPSEKNSISLEPRLHSVSCSRQESVPAKEGMKYSEW